MAKVFKLAPWPGTLVFTVDRGEWMELYAKRDGVDAYKYESSMGLTWDDSGYHLVGVFDGSVGTLAHEMAHAAMDVLNHARTGDYTQGNNQEQLCYLLGHLVELTYSIVKGDKQ